MSDPTTPHNPQATFDMSDQRERRHIERAGLLMSALLKSHPLSPDEAYALSHPLMVELALSEGLGGALLKRLQGQACALSERSELRLIEAQLQCVWLEEARLQALTERWPSRLPAPLLIKGASYSSRVAGAEALWGEAERASSDLDLLVPTAWGELYSALGQHARERDLNRANQAERSACLALSLDGLLIEAHSSLAPPPLWPAVGPLSAEAMWERGQDVTLRAGGQQRERALTVKLPPLDDQLTIALVQLLKGGGGWRVREWMDLSKLLLNASLKLPTGATWDAWRLVGLDRTFQLALWSLRATPAWSLLPTKIKAHLQSDASPTPRYKRHPLSGATPSRLERAYIRACLLSARPSP